MWWRELSKHNRRFRGAAAIALLGFVSLSVSGCGIHPLYGPTASGENLSEVMKSVDVATIASRPGLRLRNELIFGTTGGGAASRAGLQVGRCAAQIDPQHAGYATGPFDRAGRRA